MKALTPALLLGMLMGVWVGMPRDLPEPQSSLASDRDFLCAPRLQLRHPERCSPYGPGAQLTRLAQQGLYPPKPLPVAALDPALEYMPFSYIKAESGPVDIYSSADGAAADTGSSHSIPGGFVYLSYFDRFEHSGSTIYSTPQGYVRGEQVSSISPPASPGLAFSRTPDRPFGWVISGGTCTSRTPGGPQDPNGRCFTRHSVVQVYDIQRIGDWDWYMIQRDQWLEQRAVAVVRPDAVRPEGVDGDRWIAVNLYEQTVAAYADGQLLFATVASTGRHGAWTQPGVFQIWAKLDRDNMTGGIASGDDGNYYFLEDVPWVLYFDQSRALHGTYWHARFGSPSSRGCVNLAPRDAHWFFEFAEEGTWVYVWDPSGNTPTDPAAYGPGGA